MNKQQAKKFGQAEAVVMRWERSKGNTPEPKPSEIIRYTLGRLVNGYLNEPLLAASRYPNGMAHLPYNAKEVAFPVVERGFVVRYERPSTLPQAKHLYPRYVRFCQYMTVTRHNWQSRGLHHYMDNSVEEELVSSLTGQTIRRMVTAPSGDACF